MFLNINILNTFILRTQKIIHKPLGSVWKEVKWKTILEIFSIDWILFNQVLSTNMKTQLHGLVWSLWEEEKINLHDIFHNDLTELLYTWQNT